MAALRVSILIATVLMSGIVGAEVNSYWQFDSDNNGITIYTHKHTDGLIEIRAQMFTPTSYSAFLSLLEDSENVPNWIDKASHSRVINQISATENIVYTQFTAPWPARDRNMITYSKYWLNELGFTINIKDASDYTLVEQSDDIRIRSVDASWTLRKLPHGTTLIEYKAFADPGGLLPDWLINKLSKQSARTTFGNLRDQLPKYQQYSHPQIEE
ncbi:START domain-containing protein [Photobacterium sp. DNB22_13_2]